MTYALPTASFDATEATRNRIIRANQFRDLVVAQYRAGYDAMWQTPLTHGEAALTMAQLQLALNNAQATFIDVLTDSAAFVTFIQTQYAEAMTGDDPLLPARYISAPYTYTTGESGITLTALKLAWEAPEDDDNDTPE
jgi:hypothetical protein